MGHTKVPWVLHPDETPDPPWGTLRSRRLYQVNFQDLGRVSGVAYTGRITQIHWVSYRRQGPALEPALALALAPHRIRVNALAVGGVPGQSLAAAMPLIDDLDEAIAEVTPLGRVGDPADFADAALFLAAPAAGFVTGQVLAVDGGRSVPS